MVSRFDLDRTEDAKYRILVDGQVHASLGLHEEPHVALMRLREFYPDEDGSHLNLHGVKRAMPASLVYVGIDTVSYAIDLHMSLENTSPEPWMGVQMFIKRVVGSKKTECFDTDRLTVREHVMKTIPLFRTLQEAIEKNRLELKNQNSLAVSQSFEEIRTCAKALGPYILVRWL